MGGKFKVLSRREIPDLCLFKKKSFQVQYGGHIVGGRSGCGYISWEAVVVEQYSGQVVVEVEQS